MFPECEQVSKKFIVLNFIIKDYLRALIGRLLLCHSLSAIVRNLFITSIHIVKELFGHLPSLGRRLLKLCFEFEVKCSGQLQNSAGFIQIICNTINVAFYYG